MFAKSILMFRGVLGSWLADSRWLLLDKGKFKLTIPLPVNTFSIPVVQIHNINTKSHELVIEGVVKQNDGKVGGSWFGEEKV